MNLLVLTRVSQPCGVRGSRGPRGSRGYPFGENKTDTQFSSSEAQRDFRWV